MSNDKKKKDHTHADDVAPKGAAADIDFHELFGDAAKLAVERAWYSSELDDKVTGIAYLMEQTQVGTGADQRIVPAIIVRLLASARGMRNDKVVELEAGEDLAMIASYNVSKRVLGFLGKGPVVCQIRRGEARPHPTKRGQTIRDFDIQAWPMELTPNSKHLSQAVREDVNKSYKLMSTAARDAARALAETAATENGAPTAPF